MSEYTEQDVDLVSRAFHEVDPVDGARPQDWHEEARAALAALAAAGRLLPPGGQQQEEWKVTGIPGEGYPPYEYHWHADEAGLRAWLAPIRARADWAQGPVVHRRSVTTFPDGSQHIGAWREVSDE